MSLIESLPREIILNILSRVPIASLVKIKFVCRSWRNLLQDPHFVNMHFSHTAGNDPGLILHSDCPIKNQLYFVNLSCQNPDHETAKKFFVPSIPEFDVVGSCNCLLCLCDSFGNNVYVYNPFRMDYMEFPISRQHLNQEVVYGFGFVPRTKEYKVVKIVSYTDADGYFTQPEVQIFTLGYRNWRTLGQRSCRPVRTPTQVLVNGRLHWICFQIPIIFSFDLEDEKFLVVPKPNCCGSNRCGYQLVVLGDCLSAAAFCNNGNFEVWVMKEYGVKESWVKEYNIGTYLPRGLEQEVDQSFKISKFYLDSGFVRVLCLLKNGEILLEYECRALVTYDPKHETFKDLMYQGMQGLFETAIHVGSLNWIDSVIDH